MERCRVVAITVAAVLPACAQSSAQQEVRQVDEGAASHVTLLAPPSSDTQAESSITDTSPPESLEPSAGPVVTALDTEDGASGLVDGVLKLSDGCLYISIESDGDYLVVFPFGSMWDESSSTVVVSPDAAVSVGEVLSGTGEDQPVSDLAPWFVSDFELSKAQNCAQVTGITDAYVIGYVDAGT